MVKLCLFDLDGTLLDTLGNIAGHMNATLAAFDLAPFPVSDYRYFVGNGAAILTERVLRARGVYTPSLMEAFFLRFQESYISAPEQDVTVYDGIKELLAALRAQGVAAAVCTNKPHAAAVASVERFFGSDTFFAIAGAKEGVPLKPAPDAARQLMQEAGASTEETLFIGDSDADMLTAVAAGIRGFGAKWGFRTPEELTEAGAHALLDHPTDLLRFLF